LIGYRFRRERKEEYQKAVKRRVIGANNTGCIKRGTR
jgi:hypothetical protein